MQIRKASFEHAYQTARSKNPVLFDRIISSLDMSGNCWNWIKSAGDGYGNLRVNGARPKVHRLMYEFFKGDIVDGLCIRHLCDNPRCCNPIHLYMGTHQDNMNDRAIRGRSGYLKGSANGRAKLSENDALYIRTSTESPSLLAKRYNVSKQTIHEIRSNKKWKHVGESNAS